MKFGTAAASSFTVNSAIQITATSPAGTGVVDVTVVTPGGTSPVNHPGDQFSYPITKDSIGIYLNGNWYLDCNGNGNWDGTPTDALYSFGGQPGTIPVAGDWNGDGKDEIGIYLNGYWYLDLNGNGKWDGTPTDGLYWFGGQPGTIPVVGDWNGAGKDEIGIYLNGNWYLDRNGNGNWDGTSTDSLYSFGGQPGTIPVAGDWNGGGKSEIGIYLNGYWYLDRNGNGNWDGTSTDSLYWFGGQPGTLPVAGDWNADGKSEIGIYLNGNWYLDLNGNGTWDNTSTDSLSWFGGQPGTLAVAGKWQQGGSPLKAASVVTAPASDDVPLLTQADLRPIVTAAIARWANAGLDAAAVAKLAQVQFVISDLPGSYLGEEEGSMVYIDGNAAGNGWFVDPTPATDEEFVPSPGNQQLRAIDPRAVDRIDLLTVAEHELGHVLGLGDLAPRWTT